MARKLHVDVGVLSFTRRLGALRRNLALHDALLCAFHGYWWLRALLAPESADAVYARLAFAVLLGITVGTVLLVRGEWLASGFLRALLYRCGIGAPLLATYLVLRRALPALAVDHYDASLLGLDRVLFGETPALWLEPFASAAAVEWFAFFYYGYFGLLGMHLFGALFVDRGRRAAELLLGLCLVTCIGQALYSVVPGVGPYAFGGVRFEAELSGGMFLSRVMALVDSAGAGLDIFPSLHTAHPLLLLLHALRHRRQGPFRFTWLPTAFVVFNMVVSTMFLRFHYGCDVLAGIALAVFAQRAAVAAVARAQARDRGQPLWEELSPAWLVPEARPEASTLRNAVASACTMLRRSCGSASSIAACGRWLSPRRWARSQPPFGPRAGSAR